MVKCPRCGKEGRLTNREWNYAEFHVKQYKCVGCEKAFMEYYYKGKLSHTIPSHKGSHQQKISQKKKAKTKA